MPKTDAPIDTDPLWYKDAVFYEVHVRAFFDSDGDGKGDFRGLTEKLDYLQDLGVTAIWLLPFYPSPLKDDGYDIADYTAVHPSYGTLADVEAFVQQAHRRGLRVITELVCNHTSDQHPWFQRARHAKPGTPERDFYVWSDTLDRYKDARIIFKDFETSNWSWDAVANAYYWHRFYSHQPDLNFDHPPVHKAIFDAMDFWLKMGIDGMRLDAIPYLYEREGTSCENLPETYAFLRDLRRHVDDNFQGRVLLAEANQWPEDAVAYFGQGDECHMAFHFPLMPRLFMAIRMEDRFPIIEILRQTPEIPQSCQWALFLRNHDELTLEMVTDEERDYMYQTYAQDRQARINLGIRRRLAPLLGNNRRKIELMNGLLFSLPGTPVLYYGDEIGMGDNIYLGDRNGVRTPMQWSPDRNAGFSRTNPQRLFLPVIIDPEYHYEAINVESQQGNQHSLLWWMKRLIALRKRSQAFGRGSLKFLQPDNPKILAFLRSHEKEQILVIANLSRFPQCTELDLSAHKGLLPIEMFGKIEFPPITDRPYFITLGPHSFYWFSLEASRPVGQIMSPLSPGPAEVPVLAVREGWTEVLSGRVLQQFLALLPEYLRSRRWFGGKGRRIKSVDLAETLAIPSGETPAYLTLLRVEYAGGSAETYLLPLGLLGVDPAAVPPSTVAPPIARITRQAGGADLGYLVDPTADRGFAEALLATITGQRTLSGGTGQLQGLVTSALSSVLEKGDGPLDPAPLKGEQSNTSVAFGERLILKLFRHIEPGANPEWEIGRMLTERAAFPYTPRTLGALKYVQPGGITTTFGVLQEFRHSEGDGWRYTLDALSHFFDRVLAGRGAAEKDAESPPPRVPFTIASLLERVEEDPPTLALLTIGAQLEWARLLGQRTGEMHLALADSDDPDLCPEPFTSFYQRSIYQSMRNLTSQVFQLLDRNRKDLPPAMQESAARLLAREASVFQHFHALIEHRVTATRTRYHGDYHLGQVLYTGKDFVILDFEGEPHRPLSERSIKRSPLRDVAGMLRSFAYASQVALRVEATGVRVRPEDVAALGPWADFFVAFTSQAFLRSYLAVTKEASFIPRTREELTVLLGAYLLEKAIYELGYELNSRPDWIGIPLEGILHLLDGA